MKVKNKEEIIISEETDLQVYIEPHSLAKTIAFPFPFPDGVGGILTLTHNFKGAFDPKIIKKITIEFNENNTR